MELPEVGSKWVAKVDYPRGARVKKGDVIEVTDADDALVGYTGGWCCLTEYWRDNFEPYQEGKSGFQVGDKVKCLHPTIVYDEFKDQVGEVMEFYTFDEGLKILYPCGTEQVAWVEKDGVVLVESAQTKKPPTGLTAEGYTPKGIKEPSGKIASDGGPSEYYDFPEGWVTWNDLADYKAQRQWKQFSFHLGNIGKVLMRWGDKEGAALPYDTRKIIYSGLRILLMLEGPAFTRDYLQRLLNDPQFKE